MWTEITKDQRKEFNQLATHPLQSFEWGEFREKTGITVIRKGYFEKKRLIQAFQLTIHPIPHTTWNIGYLPKGIMPTKELLEEVQRIGKSERCIFIQLEPNVENYKLGIKNQGKNGQLIIGDWVLPRAAHPLFTKHTLVLDLTKSEEELLAHMHPKARYNIKVAQKHHVLVSEENTQKAFDIFWQLTEETTTRQQFFAHHKTYHELQWKTLPHTATANTLSSHLLIARYGTQPLTAWIVFVFHNALYYPYGASSQQHREVMHSTDMMWEAIRFGKKHGLQLFDLWGATAPGSSPSDPWFGFTQFKERFGPERIEFIGSYDIVIDPILYNMYKIADKLRWLFLRFR